MTDTLARWAEHLRRGELPPEFKPTNNNIMDTGIVKTVQDTGKKWQDFIKVKIVLEDGRSGIVNAKSFPPPYNTGDTVEVKETWPDGNLKKVGKVSEDFQSAPTGQSEGTQAPSSPSTDNRQRDIQIGQSVNLAVETLSKTVWVETFDNEKYIDQVKYMTREYYQMLDELREEIK